MHYIYIYVCTRLGIQTMYLTTHDKQDFYSHIGYTYCDPVHYSTASGKIDSIWSKMVSFLYFIIALNNKQ